MFYSSHKEETCSFSQKPSQSRNLFLNLLKPTPVKPYDFTFYESSKSLTNTDSSSSSETKDEQRNTGSYESATISKDETHDGTFNCKSSSSEGVKKNMFNEEPPIAFDSKRLKPFRQRTKNTVVNI